MIHVQVGLTRKKHGLGHESTHFCFESKKLSSGQVFFRSGQKILTRFAMSIYIYIYILIGKIERKSN